MNDAYSIDKEDDGSYQFGGKNTSPKKFTDCVESSVRNVLNLMLYNANEKNFLLNQEKTWEDDAYIRNLKEKIEGRGTIDLKDRREMLRLFYLEQTPEEVVNGDIFFTTFWNTVLCEREDVYSQSLYKLRYTSGTNELTSGLINAAKTYWNLVYLLHDDCSENLEMIKGHINELEDDITKENVDTSKIERVFKEIFDLMNPNYKVTVTVESLLCVPCKHDHNVKEFFGKLNFTVKDLSETNELFKFSVQHKNGHAYTIYDFGEKAVLSLESFLNQNPGTEDFWNVSKVLSLYRKLKQSENISSTELASLLKENEEALNNIKNEKINESIKLLLSEGFFKDQSFRRNFIEDYISLNSNISSVEDIMGFELKHKKQIKSTIENKKIKDEILNYDEQDFYELFNYKTLMSEAIERLDDEEFDLFVDIYRENLKQGINKIAFKGEQDFKALDYAINLGKWNKAKKLAGLIDDFDFAQLDIKEKICNGDNFTFENIKEFSDEDIFSVNNKKSIMAFAIEKLSDEDFKLLIKNVDKKILEENFVYKYTDDQGIIYDTTAFTYAVKNKEFSKAQEILNKIDQVNKFDTALVEENCRWYSSLGFLLKENQIDFIKENKHKFDFNKSEVFLDQEGQRYSAKEFITQILKNDSIIQELNI